MTTNNIECCNCGIAFAVPSTWVRARRNDHKWFHCPNGHQQHFSSETGEEKAIRRAQRAEQNNARLREERDAAKLSAAAQKGHVTRLRKLKVVA